MEQLDAMFLNNIYCWKLYQITTHVPMIDSLLHLYSAVLLLPLVVKSLRQRSIQASKTSNANNRQLTG
jgi:hypothetical protein